MGDSTLRIKLYWPKCKLGNKEWASDGIDAFWVECTLEEAEEKVFPYLSPRQLVESRRNWERVEMDRKSSHIEKNRFCYLVSKDLNSIISFPWYYPYSGQWNAYGPFREIYETEITELEEASKITPRDASFGLDISDPLVNKALDIAVEAHWEQLDKGGRPYLEHPVAVAHQMDSTSAIVVALLHDVCEDSEVTFEELESAGFPYEIVSAIKAITKIQGEAYEDYLQRVKHNKLALIVKIADMNHNSDLSRLKVISEEDLKRKKKYGAAVEFLSSFTCETCGNSFSASQMGDKTTRDGKIVCKACLTSYD